MIVTWIAKSFDEDVDYYVQVDEIERIENQHYEQISKAGVKHVN
jgi:cytochrome o ubiquinol oxidase subunit 1